MHLLEEQSAHNGRQHGFRPQRGIQTALAILYETIAAAKANRHNNIDIALPDISRAFDKVWDDGLKYKILQLTCLKLLKK